tara:strand:+ start:1905 stop:2279 length:375 start_codon:yes stop_codon:yes gene_type:complete
MSDSYVLSCGCWRDNHYDEQFVGKVCQNCDRPFRKTKITKMRQQMLQKPVMKMDLGTELKLTKELRSNQGYISLAVFKRTKYVFDSRSNKVVKKLDDINRPGKFDKTLDVYEYFTRKSRSLKNE